MCDPAQGVTPCVYDVCIHVRGIDFGSLNGDAFSNTCSISSDDVPDQVNLVALLLSSTSAGYFPHLSVLSRSNQWHWRTSDPVVTCEKKSLMEWALRTFIEKPSWRQPHYRTQDENPNPNPNLTLTGDYKKNCGVVLL